MHDRLKQARELAGFKTAADGWRAVRAAGHAISQQAYNQHENGTHPNFHNWVPTYAELYGVDPNWLMTGRGQPRKVKDLTDGSHLIEMKLSGNTYTKSQPEHVDLPRIVGRIAAGVFRTVETVDRMTMRKFPLSPFPVDPRYPAESQFDLLVEGDSVNNIAKDGDVLRCVKLENGNISLHDGDLVVVRRMNGGLAETTAKRWRRDPQGQGELWFDSDEPSLQGRLPLQEQDEIVAVAIYSYRPTRPLAALP